VISDKWTVRKEEQGTFYRVDLKLLTEGAESIAIDQLVRKSFKREAKHTLFCPTAYAGITASPREDLERKAIKFFANDAGLCGGFLIQIGLDAFGPR
jgi:hypothetical protein